MNGIMFPNQDTFRRINPSDIMIKKKDHNILHFAKQLFADDPRVKRKAKTIGLDQIKVHETFIKKGQKKQQVNLSQELAECVPEAKQ